MKESITALLLIFSLSVCFASETKLLKIDQELQALVATEGVHYQWYKDGELVVNSNTQSLKIYESGNYEVEIVNENMQLDRLETTVAVNATGAIIRIFTIGDSTVQDYNAGYYPRRGYGQELPFFFNPANVQIINKGAGGTSSKSFYKNQWPAIRDALLPGDFVFIAFGINDRNPDTARYAPTSVGGGPAIFEGYLTKYINETKAKGGFPVLLTPSRRGSYQNGQPYDAWHDHPIAVRNVAKSLNVPLIDVDAKQKVVMQQLGEAYTSRYWYNIYPAGEYPNYPTGSNDNLHLQQMGAIETAKMITDGIKELSTDKNVSTLIPYLKPLFEVKVASNLKASDSLITRTLAYPQGITVTVKTIPKKAQLRNFLNWYEGPSKNVSSKTLYSFAMVSFPLSYLANFKGGVIAAIKDAQLTDLNSLIYPNPFTNNFNISTANQYLIYNADGVIVEKGSCPKNCLIGETLKSGMYLIEIQDDLGVSRIKVIKQ